MKGKHRLKGKTRLQGAEGVKQALEREVEGKRQAKLQGKRKGKVEGKKKARRGGRLQHMEPEATHESSPSKERQLRAAIKKLKRELRAPQARQQRGQDAASAKDDDAALVGHEQPDAASPQPPEEAPRELPGWVTEHMMTIPPAEEMEIRYCRTHSEVEAAAMEVLSLVPADESSLIIGFDMEWEYEPVEKPPALIQLCVQLGDTRTGAARFRCYLLHLARLGCSAEARMPPALGQLLQHPKVTLATVGDGDERKLLEHHLKQHRLVQINRIHRNIELLREKRSSSKEVRDAFKWLSKNPSTLFRCSLQTMLKEHMGKDIIKDLQQANDAWERDEDLPAPLVRYAATDAFAQLLLFHVVQQCWTSEKETLGIHGALSLEDIIVG